MNGSPPSIIKRNQQPIFIGMLLFAALVYPCHSFFNEMLRHAGNRQQVHYVGKGNLPCEAIIYPSGSIGAGKPSTLEIDEFFDSCFRQILLPASPAATITSVDAGTYQVSFVPEHEGSLELSFRSADGSFTYTYQYKADPAPIVAILLVVAVLAPAIAFLIALVLHRIRSANDELRKRAKAASSQAPTVPAPVEGPEEVNAVPAVSTPEWLAPTVEALTQYGKLIASVTAIVYLTGIFVVNAYLSQWGASDYSLLKPRALLAGLWFFLFLSLCIVPMGMFVGKASKPTPPRENSGTVWFLLIGFGRGLLQIIGFLLALCFSAIPLTIVSGLVFMGKQGGAELSGSEVLHIGGILLAAQFFGAIIGQNALQLIQRLARGKIAKHEVGQVVGSGLALLGFVLFFAFAFARVIYWKIPEAFGGGGVHKEIVTFKDLDDQTSAMLQNGVSCVDTTSRTYNVAFSGDGYILLACPKSGQIFRLDRKYIVAESWPNE